MRSAAGSRQNKCSSARAERLLNCRLSAMLPDTLAPRPDNPSAPASDFLVANIPPDFAGLKQSPFERPAQLARAAGGECAIVPAENSHLETQAADLQSGWSMSPVVAYLLFAKRGVRAPVELQPCRGDD